ncbi:MAG: crosslink repair DNA glycosylase YcaQ family protein [Actinomycetes bacterium]|jgi:uncharacterized protein YcaQ|nr:winged helix-turn-helix domain-containing protein [Acidimicrobiia bacterium]
MRRLSLDQARRMALGAQGFTEPRRNGRVDVRHFRRVLRRLGVVQLDSVNVFVRTHYMPFFSRLGPYDRDALDRWLWRSGEVFEYWAHEASLLPVEDHPLFRFRMAAGWHWERLERTLEERPDLLDRVEAEVAEKGPLRTAHLSDPGAKPDGGMWNWSDGKVALEALFLVGRVTTAYRENFVRHYDLTSRVIPQEVLDLPTPDDETAQTELLEKAARALGVGTYDDLADYYRIRGPRARPLIERLVADGRLVEAQVEGWDRVAYVHPDAVVPRRVEGSALLSPFDSLVWHRPRTERLFGFRYRIEIYTPAPKRVYGYYVLPYLLDGRLVARVDLKSERKGGRLQVKGTFAEDGADRPAVAKSLAADLQETAGWLGLADVEVHRNGDLAEHLAKAL